MTKLEEALKKWESRAMRPIAYGAGFPDHLILELLQDLRAAIANCSVLEWHPANEEPLCPGEYICVVELYPFRKTVVSIYRWNSGWNCSSLDNILKWTELPERPEEQRE